MDNTSVEDKSEKRNEESLNIQPSNIPVEWRYNAHFSNSSMGVVPNGNPVAGCGDAAGPSGSSGSMVESFGPTIWEQNMGAGPLGFGDMNVANGAMASDPLALLKGGMFLSNMMGMLPHNLSQFPADSGFIERAARFSSFSGGQFGDILNPFSAHHHSVNPYFQGGEVMQGPPGVPMKSVASKQPQRTDGGMPETSKDIEGTLTKNQTTVERQGVTASGNDSEEAEASGGGTQDDERPLSMKKGLGSMKRKRIDQDSDPEQDNGVPQQSGGAGKNSTETEQKGEQNSTPPGSKANGKNGKQSSQASDSAKEDYIHVRARRGQATNSHSLAERVRREKISERMKFLQDLVPGCSKVTGKAVMLDEIINYVQSLQRQVEFLSMKLSTVNPKLDINLERLLAKDPMFAARAGPSSGLGFLPDMPLNYPSFHATQHPTLQPGVPAIGNSSDALRRTISAHLSNMVGGIKDPNAQVPNVWDDELHNVVQMGFNASDPLENQETNCSEPASEMKSEP